LKQRIKRRIWRPKLDETPWDQTKKHLKQLLQEAWATITIGIALAGKFPGKDHNKIGQIIHNLGGTVVSRVDEKTTVLIAPEKDNSKKVIAADANCVCVVVLAWLLQCEKSGI
jgi:NAD-dependent DNA ligase